MYSWEKSEDKSLASVGQNLLMSYDAEHLWMCS